MSSWAECLVEPKFGAVFGWSKSNAQTKRDTAEEFRVINAHVCHMINYFAIGAHDGYLICMICRLFSLHTASENHFQHRLYFSSVLCDHETRVWLDYKLAFLIPLFTFETNDIKWLLDIKWLGWVFLLYNLDNNNNCNFLKMLNANRHCRCEDKLFLAKWERKYTQRPFVVCSAVGREKGLFASHISVWTEAMDRPR